MKLAVTVSVEHRGERLKLAQDFDWSKVETTAAIRLAQEVLQVIGQQLEVEVLRRIMDDAFKCTSAGGLKLVE